MVAQTTTASRIALMSGALHRLESDVETAPRGPNGAADRVVCSHIGGRKAAGEGPVVRAPEVVG